MTVPGALLASGQDADVFTLDDQRVLRRYRTHDVTPHELLAMRVALAAGYPVPRVHAVRGPELVLERIPGVTMQAALEASAGAAKVAQYGALLAQLHRDLHRIEAPAELRTPFGEGAAMLHLDLHPKNVILSPAGPVVIDWSNAARGPAAADVAVSVVIFETSPVPAAAEWARTAFVAAFSAEFALEEVAAFEQAAARFRLARAHLTASERQAVSRRLR